MRGADCAKNMENVPKKYLAEKIAKNINLNNKTHPCPKKQGIFFYL
jgi:hypothetical protein